MTGFEYDADAVAREEANYRTPTAADRRAFVRDQLGRGPGESVLSVGCGPGFEPAEFASAAQRGHVAGVDRNPLMLARARDRCPDAVSLCRGDATALPVADGAFDAAVSVQVYEYVETLGAALAELHRVLDADGRAVIHATDWNSLVWHTTDRERTARVQSAWADHCEHPRLGTELRSLLQSSRFDLLAVTPYSICQTHLGEESFGHYLLESIREFVAGELGLATARAWAEDLREIDRRGETCFALTQFCYLVEPA